MPSLNDFLNRIIKGVQSKSAKLYKKYGCSPSGPVDFPVLNEFSLFMTISTYTRCFFLLQFFNNILKFISQRNRLLVLDGQSSAAQTFSQRMYFPLVFCLYCLSLDKNHVVCSFVLLKSFICFPGKTSQGGFIYFAENITQM